MEVLKFALHCTKDAILIIAVSDTVEVEFVNENFCKQIHISNDQMNRISEHIVNWSSIVKDIRSCLSKNSQVLM